MCASNEARYHDDVLACLGGIIDPSRADRRVIEAELALEAMTDIAGNVTYYSSKGNNLCPHVDKASCTGT